MDLPDELWLLVLKHIEVFKRQDITAMALCSRFFCTELEPRLYHTVTLRSAAAFRAFERLALYARNPKNQRFRVRLPRRRVKLVNAADVLVPRVHVLRLVRHLAITFSWVSGGIELATRRSSRAILTACYNVETFYIDRRFSASEVVALIHNQPNVTRAFLANEYFVVAPLILHRGSVMQYLTHIWLNNFCHVTVFPDAFPALTHIVAGFERDVERLEAANVLSARELLRFTRLQRLLLLIPARQPSLRPSSLVSALAALRDRRIYTVTDEVPDSWTFKSIGRWVALTDVRGGGPTWTSGTPVWDGSDEPSLNQ